MGLYLNPEDRSCLAWVEDNGTRVDPKIFGDSIREQKEGLWAEAPSRLAVCVIFNPSFKAAGVGFGQAELIAFLHEDGRHKLWYLVPKEKIAELVPNIDDWLKHGKKNTRPFYRD